MFRVYFASIMLMHLITHKRFDIAEKIEMRYNEQSTLDLIIKDTKKWNF